MAHVCQFVVWIGHRADESGEHQQPALLNHHASQRWPSLMNDARRPPKVPMRTGSSAVPGSTCSFSEFLNFLNAYWIGFLASCGDLEGTLTNGRCERRTSVVFTSFPCFRGRDGPPFRFKRRHGKVSAV
jgi:hypothetical protein